MMTQAESAEDILTDSLALFGGESAGDDHHHIRYGPLVLSVACKVGFPSPGSVQHSLMTVVYQWPLRLERYLR